jgi:hypothetical protein
MSGTAMSRKAGTDPVATHHPTIYTDRLITADELAAMPEHARYELVLGQLADTP